MNAICLVTVVKTANVVIDYQALNNSLKNAGLSNGFNCPESTDFIKETETGFSFLYYDMAGNSQEIYSSYTFIPQENFSVILSMVTQGLKKGVIVFQETILASSTHMTTIHTITPQNKLSENLKDFV